MREDKIITPMEHRIAVLEDANAAADFVLQAIKERHGDDRFVVRFILEHALHQHWADGQCSAIQPDQKD